MTGRDIILYILENHLEDEPFFSNDSVIGLVNTYYAAAKIGVGPETINAWFDLKVVPKIQIGQTSFMTVKDLEKMEKRRKK